MLRLARLRLGGLTREGVKEIEAAGRYFGKGFVGLSIAYGAASEGFYGAVKEGIVSRGALLTSDHAIGLLAGTAEGGAEGSYAGPFGALLGAGLGFGFAVNAAVGAAHVFRIAYAPTSVICDELLRQACKMAQLRSVKFIQTIDKDVVMPNRMAVPPRTPVST